MNRHNAIVGILMCASAAQVAACGEAKDDDFDLEVAQAALSGPELTLGDVKFATFGNLFTTTTFQDFNFVTDFPTVSFANVGQFKFGSGNYRFSAPQKAILGPKALPATVALPPPNATFKNGMIQVPGYQPVSSKKVALLFGIAKGNHTEKAVSKIMIEKWGSDFGLIRPKLVKGVIGFGGYSYGGKEVPGLTVPKGYGVSGASASAYGDALKGRNIPPAKLESWKNFVFEWGKTLSDRERYLAKTKKAVGGDGALANKMWKAENKAHLKETQQYLLVINPPAAAPTTRTSDYPPAAGTVHFTLSNGADNMRITTGNARIDAKLELQRVQMIRDLGQIKSDGNTLLTWAILSGYVATGTALLSGPGAIPVGIAALATVSGMSLTQQREYGNRIEAYIDHANDILLEGGYGAVLPSTVP